MITGFDVYNDPRMREQYAEILAGDWERLQGFSSRIIERNSDAFKELLWNSNVPCFDKTHLTEYEGETAMLRKCLWKGKDLPCRELFVATPADVGICCTFNAARAEEAFKNAEYASYLETRRTHDLDMAHQVGNPLPQDEELDMTTQFGVKRGLTVLLDAHKVAMAPSSMKTDAKGFRAYVGRKMDYPAVREGGVLIRAGEESRVAITAQKLDSKQEDLGRLDPTVRGCYFEDEKELEGSWGYSKHRCLYECQLGLALEETGSACLPENYPPLGEWLERCNYQQRVNFVDSLAKEDLAGKCLHCLSDCSATFYSTTVSASPLRDCDAFSMGTDGFICNFGDFVLPQKWGKQARSNKFTVSQQ